MNDDEDSFPVRVSKANGKVYQVQHDGASPGRWTLVEKPELAVMVEESRLWQVHGQDIQELHKHLRVDGSPARATGTNRT